MDNGDSILFLVKNRLFKSIYSEKTKLLFDVVENLLLVDGKCESGDFLFVCVLKSITGIFFSQAISVLFDLVFTNLNLLQIIFLIVVIPHIL